MLKALFVWQLGQVFFTNARAHFVLEKQFDVVIDAEQQLLAELLERKASEGFVLSGSEVEKAVC